MGVTLSIISRCISLFREASTWCTCLCAHYQLVSAGRIRMVFYLSVSPVAT